MIEPWCDNNDREHRWKQITEDVFECQKCSVVMVVKKTLETVVTPFPFYYIGKKDPEYMAHDELQTEVFYYDNYNKYVAGVL